MNDAEEQFHSGTGPQERRGSTCKSCSIGSSRRSRRDPEADLARACSTSAAAPGARRSRSRNEARWSASTSRSRCWGSRSAGRRRRRLRHLRARRCRELRVHAAAFRHRRLALRRDVLRGSGCVPSRTCGGSHAAAHGRLAERGRERVHDHRRAGGCATALPLPPRRPARPGSSRSGSEIGRPDPSRGPGGETSR